MLAALSERLSQVASGTRLDGLVLASAGSSSPSAHRSIQALARDLERSQGIPVQPAFASGPSPRPTQALEALSAKGVRSPAVASLFVSGGTLCDAVLAACAGIPVADPLGGSPMFIELVVAQAEALPPAS
jgi:sirohydrochlorin ferrochelatase